MDCSSGSRRQSKSTTVPLVLADNWRRVDFKVSLSLIPSDSSSHDSERIPLHFPLAALTPDFRGFRRRRHQCPTASLWPAAGIPGRLKRHRQKRPCRLRNPVISVIIVCCQAVMGLRLCPEYHNFSIVVRHPPGCHGGYHYPNCCPRSARSRAAGLCRRGLFRG